MPTMVLFHGFPSASHMFRDLMPMLENSFHLIAPDYPGFGQSDSPARTVFSYTFDHLAETMDCFLHQMGVRKYYTEIGGIGNVFRQMVAYLFLSRSRCRNARFIRIAAIKICFFSHPGLCDDY